MNIHLEYTSLPKFLSFQLRPICSFDKENNLLLIRLFDCPGMLEHRGIRLEEMKFIIKGNTKPKSIVSYTYLSMQRYNLQLLNL